MTKFPDWLDFTIAMFSIPHLQGGAYSQCKHDLISYIKLMVMSHGSYKSAQSSQYAVPDPQGPEICMFEDFYVYLFVCLSHSL